MSPNNVSGPNSANKKKHESPNNAASAYAHTHTPTHTHTHTHYIYTQEVYKKINKQTEGRKEQETFCLLN